MAILLKAAPLVSLKTQRLKDDVTFLKKHGINPCLKVVVVGKDPASQVYVEHKRKKCLEIGAEGEIVRLPENSTPQAVTAVLQQLNQDTKTHGIILQLPLPKHIDLDPGLLINPAKDVDGFSPINIYHLYRGSAESEFLVPCTPKGIIDLLLHYKIPLKGKKVVILGRSLIVGRPMFMLALNQNAAPTIIHSQIADIVTPCREADVIISAMGRPRALTADHFRHDGTQSVVDVGINRLADGSLVGDVDFQSVEPYVHSITPVPGGVGPMTVICLLENTISAAMRQHGLKKEI